MINNLNKSSLNDKPRFVLIDNIEFLNVNSTNALLKILEEPSLNVFFILINNPELFFQTLNGAIEASSVHKIIASKKEQNNGVLPNMGDMLSEVNLSLYSFFEL